MFDTVCQNIKNGLGALDACIKEISGCEKEGNTLYAKCAIPFNFTKDSDNELQKKCDEVKALRDQLVELGMMIEDIKGKIRKTHDEISLIELNRERKEKRFSLLRENLSLKITTLE